jgi:protein CpxP
MKHLAKHALAAGLIGALGFAAQAQTAPAPDAGPSAPQAVTGRDAHDGQGRARMQARMARRLDAFKQKLQLSPAQEGAWNAFATAMRPAPMQRPDRGEFARLTTPERIDRMKQLRAQRMAQMDQRADATKTFYAALDPQQQKVFDETTLHGFWGGHGHRRHG